MENWTKQRLQGIVRDRLDGMKLIVVSNRQPYIHTNDGGQVRCSTPASGLTAALDPILRASGGVWVANGSGDGDRAAVDARDRVAVPPEAPAYTLRRVWLPRKLEEEYYYGLANEGLWPLCHAAFHRPRFSQRNWASYKEANQCFAAGIIEEAEGKRAFVFIQDYHLALVPRLLKRKNPHLVIAQFWHIPWPNRETFRAFPWGDELLDGMLGNDLLGFHLPYHCANFLETLDCTVEARVNLERGRVERNGHATLVRAFPISIDYEAHRKMASGPQIAIETARWCQEFFRPPEILGIGVDRIDYTKGIPDRLQALDLLFEKHPEYVGRLAFLQVGVPSRTAIRDYGDLNRTLEQQVETINRKWGNCSWKPVVFVQRQIESQALTALHLMADFCVVSSLHDGMNLVAKEFVASRIDGDGVLILSQFTGAARELTDALIVNPFAPEEMAARMHEAINLPASVRRRRMNQMRSVVAANNIYKWAGEILLELSRIDAHGQYARMTAGIEPLTYAEAAE